MSSFSEQPDVQPAYIRRFNAERAQMLYVEALKLIRKGKLYRDPSFTAGVLAQQLHTNTRYISAATAIVTGNNFSALMNSLRLADAVKMLRSEKHNHFTVEEIALQAGFASRQVFYKVFQQMYHCTPRQYRRFDTGELTQLLHDLNKTE